MARIAIRTANGIAGPDVLFAHPADPIHLSVTTLAPGEAISLSGNGLEGAAHVWKGAVKAGGENLPAGSSVILEAGARQAVVAGTAGATLAVFFANGPPEKAGMQAHLLPDAQVPRYAPEPGAGGAAGGLHANGDCPDCSIWLHDNRLPGMAGDDAATREVAERSVHSHSEDEIIFVTDGAMRLGARLFGPGTAVAIARDTFYSFTPGPEGLAFINFRPSPPAAFRMKSGGSFDEAGYWQERVAAPRYLAG